MKVKRFGLTARIVAVLSVALALLVGVTAFSIKNILDAQGHVNKVAGDINVRLAALEAQGEMIRDVQIRVRNIVLLDDPRAMRDEMNKLQAVRNVYDDSESRMTTFFNDNDSRELIAELVRLRALARPKTDKAIELGLVNQNAEATKLLLEEIAPNIEKRLGVLQKLIAQEQENARETAAAAASAHDRATLMTALIGAIAVLLSLGIGGVLLFFAVGIDSAASIPGRDMA